jgi:S1-C subfamily serine protease
MAGRLVGINTAIYSRSGGSQGIGFAIPANMVRLVVTSARSGGGSVKRPWLGAKLQALTPELSKEFNLARPAGAVVTSVTADSPAAKGGLKPGDVIVAVGDQPVDDPNAFDYRFITHALGGKVDLGVIRGGKASKLPVALETAPESPREEIVIESRSPFLGAKVANLSPALADEMRLETATEGVAVTEVGDGTVAQQLGFQKGDIVVSVNNSKIAKTADLARVAKAGARVWRVTIQRGGQQISAVFGG